MLQPGYIGVSGEMAHHVYRDTDHLAGVSVEELMEKRLTI